jgi:hypothetical protein
MMPPPFCARVALVLLFLWSGAAAGAGWDDLVPGVTPARLFFREMGRPTQEASSGRDFVVTYLGDTAPPGTRGVRAVLTSRTGKLMRVDVFPRPAPTREALEAELGPACDSRRGRKACYTVKATPDSQLAFHYASLGVTVFFEQGQVQAMTYLPPRSPAPRVLVAPRLEEADAPAPELAARPEPASEPVSTPVSAPSFDPALAPASEPVPAPVAPGEPDVATASMDELMRPATISDPGAPTSAPAPVAQTPPAAAGAPTPTPAATTDATGVSHNVIVADLGEGPREPPEVEKPDLLTLGGMYYQRGELSGARGGGRTQLKPLFPALVDVYLDVKPSSDLRGFVTGRLLYDPLDATLSEPHVLLDQLWFRFVLADAIFVTAGRQQIKWGSSRVWNPTDFLRQPNLLPLDVFDLRTGVDMLKVNIPWESLASNLWLIATADLEGGTPDRARYGGAVRAEVALGPSELAATAAFEEGRRPRYGLDWSGGLGRFDLNAEVALLRGDEVRRWERTADGFQERDTAGTWVQASGGAMTQIRLGDINQVIVRVEGLFNQRGYSDRAFLTWLRTTGDYEPLYFSRFYGMGQLSFSRRSVFAPVLSLTALTSLSDPSVFSRVDFAFTPRRDVAVQLFVESPLGPKGGEFRFQPDPSVADMPATSLGLFRTGFSIRMRM